MFNKDKLNKPMVAFKRNGEFVKDGTAPVRILSYHNSLNAITSYFFSVYVLKMGKIKTYYISKYIQRHNSAFVYVNLNTADN